MIAAYKSGEAKTKDLSAQEEADFDVRTDCRLLLSLTPEFEAKEPAGFSKRGAAFPLDFEGLCKLKEAGASLSVKADQSARTLKIESVLPEIQAAPEAPVFQEPVIKPRKPLTPQEIKEKEKEKARREAEEKAAKKKAENEAKMVGELQARIRARAAKAQ